MYTAETYTFPTLKQAEAFAEGRAMNQQRRIPIMRGGRRVSMARSNGSVDRDYSRKEDQTIAAARAVWREPREDAADVEAQLMTASDDACLPGMSASDSAVQGRIAGAIHSVT